MTVGLAVTGLAWPFAPMHLREVLVRDGGTLTDTMHIVLGIVSVLLMLIVIGFGAVAFGKRFRLYSIATMVMACACCSRAASKKNMSHVSLFR